MISIKDIEENGLTRDQAAEIDTKIREGFGRRLYAAIVKADVTQAEVSRRVGTGRYNISNYINGRALPTGAMLEKLAKALNVRPDELLPENAFANAVAERSPIKNIWSITSTEGGNARVRLDKVVRMNTAMKIGQLIADDDASSSD